MLVVLYFSFANNSFIVLKVIIKYIIEMLLNGILLRPCLATVNTDSKVKDGFLVKDAFIFEHTISVV